MTRRQHFAILRRPHWTHEASGIRTSSKALAWLAFVVGLVTILVGVLT